jgi:hypothetical protein
MMPDTSDVATRRHDTALMALATTACLLGRASDRSYSGVLVDLDGDGDLDVVVSNDLPDPKTALRTELDAWLARYPPPA